MIQCPMDQGILRPFSSHISMNPATNDSPLEFNQNKNQPPIVVIGNDRDVLQNQPEGSNGRRRQPQEGNGRQRNRKRNDNARNSMQPDSSSSSLDNPMPWNVMPFPMLSPMQNESSLLTVMNMPNFNQFPYVDPNIPSVVPMIPPTMHVKEVIHCNNCTLFPPPLNAVTAPTRERPLGCRTVFVGGLPENVTEDIIREVFERCGPITIIRMSKKNFCHIRFEAEEFIDNAIYMSGYRMRIGSENDNPRTGRLHVDYAQAREDQYEWECNQRAIQRQMRHQERMEQERLRPPSPPLVIHYSEHEALQVIEKLRVTKGCNETFSEAINTLIKWMERGDCCKKSCGMFYSMVQGTNSHVRCLVNEKTEHEEELSKARDNFNKQMQAISTHFDEIDKVFTTACHQKVWDHFTKAQRKNIEMWRKQMQEVKKSHLQQVWNERGEAEMDLSDEEGEPTAKKSKADYSDSIVPDMVLNSQIYALKEENDTLKCQLEAYKNEVDLNKADYHNEIETKDKQMKLLQQALQGMQQQLMLMKKDKNSIDSSDKEQRYRDFNACNDQGEREQSNPAENSIEYNHMELCVARPSVNERVSRENTPGVSNPSPSSSGVKIIEEQARLIGLISTFLHVHPFGASVDYIWSYLQQLDESLRPSDVENLMLKFPAVFKQQFSGIGAKIERKWIFQGFNMNKS